MKRQLRFSGLKSLILGLCIFWTYTSSMAQSFTGSTTYDFRDGSIITNQTSGDGKLTLGGAYIHHGTTYGLDLKVGQTISINVDGSCTVRFLGSAYSGLKMEGTAASAGDLGTQNTQVVSDRVDTYDFVYSGAASTLTFTTVTGTGGDTYLPEVTVIPLQAGKDFSTADKNVPYFFDLRDGSIVAASGASTIEAGLFKIEAGCCNGYTLNGSQHGVQVKTGNIITLQVAGNSYIRIGGDAYTSDALNATSSTGAFDVSSINNLTGSTFADGSYGPFVDLQYVGDAGTVVLTAAGSAYIPYIEVSPIPYDVSLTSWVQKSGTITLNGVQIDYTSGADASSNATVSVSSGTVGYTTAEKALAIIDLGGNSLSGLIPSLTGDVSDTQINGDLMEITVSDGSTLPSSFTIRIVDSSLTPATSPGTTYTYKFNDGSELAQSQSINYNSLVSQDGILTIDRGTGSQFRYNDPQHGMVARVNNVYAIPVSGKSDITFTTCTYSADGSVFRFRDSENNDLGTISAEHNGDTDAHPSTFSYTGPAGIITATLEGSDAYIHALEIKNAAVITWSGATDSDWATASNWVGGSVPAATDDVLIPDVANDPIINGEAAVNDINIESGSIVTVNSGASFAILGAASGSGQVTVKRNSTGSAGYSIIGSPVTGADLSDLSADYLYSYNEADGSWTVPSGSMNSGQGYFVGYNATNPVVSLTGNAVSGTQTKSVAKSGEGFNLVANPYAAAISLASFIDNSTNAGTIDGSIYLWDDGGQNVSSNRGGDYIAANKLGATVQQPDNSDDGVAGQKGTSGAIDHIGSLQGFFVKASAAGNVEFTADMQVSTAGSNSDNNFYRIANDEKSILKLSLLGNGLYNELIIGLLDRATFGKDYGLDAEKLSGNEVISFYSLMGGEKYSIQGLPKIEQTVELGIDLKDMGNYSIAVQQFEGFEGFDIILIDQIEGKRYNLSHDSEVSFNADANTIDRRFSVQFVKSSLLSSILESNLQVSGANGELKINYPTNKTELVTIHSIDGKLIYNGTVEFENNQATISSKLLRNHVYILRVNEESLKFILKK